MAEYRIEFSLQRAEEGSEEFVEIGFGSSGAWVDLDACTHSIDSGVTNGEWETAEGMPDPAEVMAQIAAAKADLDG